MLRRVIPRVKTALLLVRVLGADCILYILSVSGSDQPIEFFVSSPDKDSKEVYLYSSQKPFIYKSFESNVKKLMVSKDVLKVEDPKPKVEKEDPHTHTELLDHKSEG